VAALRRQTPDVRVGSGCVQNEVKSCDHHEMVVTPYGIYPGGNTVLLGMMRYRVWLVASRLISANTWYVFRRNLLPTTRE
jgi:hypothetical protein